MFVCVRHLLLTSSSNLTGPEPMAEKGRTRSCPLQLENALGPNCLCCCSRRLWCRLLALHVTATTRNYASRMLVLMGIQFSMQCTPISRPVRVDKLTSQPKVEHSESPKRRVNRKSNTASRQNDESAKPGKSFLTSGYANKHSVTYGSSEILRIFCMCL